MVTARLCAGRVQIVGMTNEYDQAWAQPDGSVQWEHRYRPVRVKRNNSWTSVDTTLQLSADGAVRPAATATGLVFSGGGSGPMVTVTEGGTTLKLGSPLGALPTPTLDGDTATYPEVLPGVDLQLRADVDGYAQVLVVKNRQAAASAKLAKLQFPITTSGLSLSADSAGNLRAKDARGNLKFAGNAPLMWDARAQAVAGALQGSSRHVKTLASNLSKASLAVTPDKNMFNDLSVVYPIYIDPGVTAIRSAWTYVKSGNPTASFWNSTDVATAGKDLWSGVFRSFFNLNVGATPIAGKYVTKADFTITEITGTCPVSGSGELDLWSTGGVGSATTWNNQPAWGTLQSSSHGATTCDSSNNQTGTVVMSAISNVRAAATGKWSNVTLALRAADESDLYSHKTFSNNPTLAITYTQYPSVTSRVTVPSSQCATGTSRPYINTKTPQLRAQITDPEGAAVSANFDWTAVGATMAIGSATVGAGASGSWLGTVVPSGALAEGSSYGWRAQGYDGAAWSAWSGSCEFTVDTTAPPTAPTVASTVYPENQWAGGANTAGLFTFGASSVSDVSAYEYGLDTNPPNQTVATASIGGTATATVTPTSDGPHTLYVRSRDRAGNESPTKVYVFSVGAGGLTAPRTGDITAGQVALTAVAQTSATGVTYQWRRGDADTWTTVPASDVTQAAGGTAVTWPFAGTTGQFAKLNWNVAKTLNDAEAGTDPLSGPLQVRAQFNNNTVASSVGITFDRNQASAESTAVGPGSVNLVTGNLTLSDTDATIDAYGSDLTVSRTYNTRRAADTDSANMFGPGWVSGTVVDDANAEYTELDVTGSLVQVLTPDGDTIGFAKRTSTAFTSEIGFEEITLTYDSTVGAYSLADADGNVTTFTTVSGAAAGRYFPTKVIVPGSNQTTTLSWEKVTVGGVDRVRPTRMLAPIADGVSCTTLARGCRALSFAYASATSGDDYLGRIKEIDFTAWDPDLSTPALRTIAVARYRYDSSGRLVATWDPRHDYTDSGGATHHLADTYTYNADGILATVTPTAEEPWTLAYTTLPTDSGKGRIGSVSRSALSAGTATTTVVYNVPTSGTGAPYDLSGTQTARWAQPEPPVAATAVFPANQVPDGNQAAGTLPGSYNRATVTYLDANARQVDVVSPGGYLSATTYDQYGNTISTLTAGDRQEALDASATDTAGSEAVVARGVSTLNLYSSDGQRMVGTYGPEHDVMLPDGSVVRGRAHTANNYDEGAPTTGEPYNLITTQVDDVRYRDATGVEHSADPRTTKTQYDWTLRQPTAVTTDPDGLNYTARTEYDAITGQVTAATTPAGGSVDTTPSTRKTIYYRATTGSGYTECDQHPEWANLTCRVQTGGQAATGPEIPATVTTYDMFDQPRTVVEKKADGTVLRTTITTYDAAGRAYETTVSAPGLGTVLPAQRTIYDQASGRQTAVQSISGGLVAATNSWQYDTLGRQMSYTDADGNQSTTNYDLLGRVATSNDGKVTRTYTYDGGSERRGLLTSVVDSQAGTFTGSYDADGKMTSETWPNGIVSNIDTDETGETVGQTYTAGSGCTSACTLYAESVVQSAHRQWASRMSSFSGQHYTYDRTGRLTTVADTVGGDCTLRTYVFNTAGDRTSLTQYLAADDGTCQSTTASSTQASTYDSADRITTSGYAYDGLGRTTTVPAADTTNSAGTAMTITYHVNDLVDTITQSGRTTNYALDVDGTRIRSWTDTASGSTASSTDHYDGSDDSPAWTQESSSRYTRTVSGISRLAGIYDSATAAIQWQLTDLHGDLVATLDSSQQGLSATSESTEYGNLRNAPDVGKVRYEWLGSNQRAADTPSGVVLMGVRLYNPAKGRFLQTDPVPGGSCNSYDYTCDDPINGSDLDGRRWCWKFCGWGHNRYWHVAYYGGRLAGDLAGLASGSSEALGAGRAIWRGYRFYRAQRRLGRRASFHPFRRSKGNFWLDGLKAIGFATGVQDTVSDWNSFRHAGYEAWRPWARRICNGTRRFARHMYPRWAPMRSYRGC